MASHKRPQGCVRGRENKGKTQGGRSHLGRRLARRYGRVGAVRRSNFCWRVEKRGTLILGNRELQGGEDGSNVQEREGGELVGRRGLVTTIASAKTKPM